jgi:hypothetical protein
MRVVDDRIDDLPNRRTLSAHSRLSEHEVVSAWDEAVSRCYAGLQVPCTVTDACRMEASKELLEAFSESLAIFRPPRVLWDHFLVSISAVVDSSRRLWRRKYRSTRC